MKYIERTSISHNSKREVKKWLTRFKRGEPRMYSWPYTFRRLLSKNQVYREYDYGMTIEIEVERPFWHTLFIYGVHDAFRFKR